jgi:hypothetical protein
LQSVECSSFDLIYACRGSASRPWVRHVQDRLPRNRMVWWSKSSPATTRLQLPEHDAKPRQA